MNCRIKCICAKKQYNKLTMRNFTASKDLDFASCDETGELFINVSGLSRVTNFPSAVLSGYLASKERHRILNTKQSETSKLLHHRLDLTPTHAYVLPGNWVKASPFKATF